MKGTVSVILINPLFEEWNAGFTMVPFIPLIAYLWWRTPCVFLENDV